MKPEKRHREGPRRLLCLRIIVSCWTGKTDPSVHWAEGTSPGLPGQPRPSSLRMETGLLLAACGPGRPVVSGHGEDSGKVIKTNFCQMEPASSSGKQKALLVRGDPERLRKWEEFVSVWVRDPRIQKEDFWHSYVDYEIFIHTNSMCFTMKTSCVRRRFREFVWLRERLQSNALLIQVPELPSKTLFFNINNREHVDQRRRGLEDFLRKILQNALLLSDSRLHLFLQSHLSSEDIEACVSGQTRYSVSEAIQKFASSNRRFPKEDDEGGEKDNSIDYGSKSSSSGLGHSCEDSSPHGCKTSPALQES